MATVRQVEVTVRDRSLGRSGVYRCDASLLKETMRFFAPAIAEQEAQQVPESEKAVSASSAAATPIALKASCELAVFEWLLQWVYYRDEIRRHGPGVCGTPGSVEAPVMTTQNVVSVLLASTFLQMPELPDEALAFMRTHLASIVLSDVDLDCVSDVHLARLAKVARPADVARTLLRLEQQDQHAHPNRRFAAALLRRLSQEYLPSDKSGAPAQMTRSQRSDSSLGWCRLCCALIDPEACAHAKTEAGASALPPLCPALVSKASSPSPSDRHSADAGKSGPRFVPSHVMLGPRGEVYDSHAASDMVRPPRVCVPSLTAESTLSVELWSWRVLGVTRYVQCRHCQHLVSWIEAPTHHTLCPSSSSAGEASAASSAKSATGTSVSYTAHDFVVFGDERPSKRPDERAMPTAAAAAPPVTHSSDVGAANALFGHAGEESWAVLHWLFYAATHDVYAEAGPALAAMTTETDAVGTPTTTEAPASSSSPAAMSSKEPSCAGTQWLAPLVCVSASELTKMRSECIVLPDVPAPNERLSDTAAARSNRVEATTGEQASAPHTTNTKSAVTTATPSPAALKRDATALSRALEAERLTATRAQFADRLKTVHGIDAPLLLSWQQLPSTVTREVLAARSGTAAVDADVQTYMERQMMWDMDEWTRLVAVRRAPRVRLSLTTALPARQTPKEETSLSLCSPLPATLPVSPRPNECARGSTLPATTALSGNSGSPTASGRRALSLTTSKRRTPVSPPYQQSPPPSQFLSRTPAAEKASSATRTSTNGSGRGSTAARTGAATGCAPPRTKLATRVSNPYAPSKPAAANTRRSTTQLSK